MNESFHTPPTGPHRDLKVLITGISGAITAVWSGLMSEVRNNAVWMVRAAAAAAAIAVAAAQPALAQTGPVYGPIDAYWRDPEITYNYPGPDKAELRIPVKASVGGQCGLAAPMNASFFNPNIDTTAWSNQEPFVAECTAPWRIAVSSANGALKSATSVAPGYTNVAPYQVKLNVNSDAGVVSSTCDVAQLEASLTSSACNFKGTASPSQGLSLQRSYGLAGSYIEVSAPAYPGPETLVAGMYYDTLTVTVSPAT